MESVPASITFPSRSTSAPRRVHAIFRGEDRMKKVNEITREDRKLLLSLLKEMRFTVDGLRPVSDAIITSGGINVKEINPKTMESKLCKGLYFAGEIIDVDGDCGGFNLQWAWSSGRLAGKTIGERINNAQDQ